MSPDHAHDHPETPVRRRVVSLLWDVQRDWRVNGFYRPGTAPPSKWHHGDGRPVTDAEAELLLSATDQEYETVRRLLRAEIKYADETVAAWSRVGQIMRPIWDKVGDNQVAIAAEILKLPEDERAELEMLLNREPPHDWVQRVM